MTGVELDQLYLADRASWREWLSNNHRSAAEIWLIYPRKHSGRPRIPYNDAVEEALCFGWIDSIIRAIDHDNSAQRFTPRRNHGSYSQTNLERLRRLIPQGLVLPEIATAVAPLLAEPFVAATDIIEALQGNEQAWANFQRYSGAYRRIRIAYVESGRRRPGEFDKRLRNLVKKSAQDKQFGFGIDAYY